MGHIIKLRSYPDASFRDVTAPNADTLYTTDTYDPFAYTTEPTATLDSLASTGASETLAILGIGLGLLTGGAALVLVTRPRRRGERQI